MPVNLSIKNVPDALAERLRTRRRRAHRADAVLDLAKDRSVTTHDASYLWLSRTLKAPLATLDARLLAASR